MTREGLVLTGTEGFGHRDWVNPVPWIAVLICLASVAWGLPRIRLSADDLEIRESCEIEVPPGLVVADTNANGVVHIVADGVVVRFTEGSVLRGASPGTPWDGLTGVGIRVAGQRDVRIEGAQVHGFLNGLVAVHADGLHVVGGDFSDNYRQRLKSTAEAEDAADWLFPHHNDERKWRDEYGGAVCIEASQRVVVRGIRVRRGQNGILLDRVTDSRIYDNDCSFLSGWGLALWRSSRNLVTRNALDFCVRGHVEGVYNRGQDSAGILCFEQSSDNVFAGNSATHGGDGFFGFAGREALGEFWVEAERLRLRRETGKEDVEALIRVPESVAREFSARGCNRNVLMGNDFSYAAAHGIEMTFSEGNVFARNRLVEDAICGIWGGYSSGSRIVENDFEGNGGMAYGLERGGVNMEHASDNWILGNRFLNNKCAIHLWWDDDAALLKSAGVAGNYRGVTGNVIANNRFEITADHPFLNLRRGESLVILQMRDDGKGNVRSNVFTSRSVRLLASNAVERAISPTCEPPVAGEAPRYRLPKVTMLGESQPVGARARLHGRHQIVMDEWGPWDHETPLVRKGRGGKGPVVFDLFGLPGEPEVSVRSGSVTTRVLRGDAGADGKGSSNLWRLELQGSPGVIPYTVAVRAPGWERTVQGTWVSAAWECTFFSWQAENDPREKLEAWRRLEDGPTAVRVTAAALDFPYGWGGPKDQKLGELMRERGPGPDHFGMVARTRLKLPAGAWRFRVLSDDGIRIRVGEKVVVENWTWHGPTSDAGIYTQAVEGEVDVVVEHFEIDGYSVLRLEVEPEG